MNRLIIISLFLLYSINSSFSRCFFQTREADEASRIIESSNSPLELKNFLEKNTITHRDRNIKCQTLFISALTHRKHSMIEVLGEFNLIPSTQSQINDHRYLPYSNYEYALMFGKKDLVAKMTLNGGLIRFNKILNSPIIFATNFNNLEAIKGVLEVSYNNVNKPNKTGWTALMLATHKGYSSIVDYLVSVGANLKGRAIGTHLDVFRAYGIYSSTLEAEYQGANALMIAVYQNKKKQIFDTLVNLQSDLNLKNKKGKNALMLAARSGNFYYVEKLLSLGVDVNEIDENGRNALMLASVKGDILLINKLIEAGADFKLKDKKGWNALMIAAQKNKLNVVKRLIEAGIEINVIGNGKEKLNALLLSANNYDVLEELVKLGGDINSLSALGENVLMRAITAKVSSEDASKIMDLGVDIYLKNSRGENSLIRAARYQRLDIVKELFYRGVNIKVKDKNGQNALFHAIRNIDDINIDLVHFLVKSGIDVNVIDKKSANALFYLIRNPRHNLEAVRFLIKSGSSTNLLNTEMDMLKNAYEYHEYNVNEDIIVELIRSGAKVRSDVYLRIPGPNYSYYELYTLLGAAIKYNHPKVSKELIRSGIDLDVYYHGLGGTALTEAVIGNQNEIAMQILESGVNVNLITRGSKKTALMFAAEKSNFSLIKKIIEEGADLSIADKNGDTAYSIAIKNKRVKLIRDILNPISNEK